MSAPEETLWSIYVARIGKGLRQQDVADAAGVNQTTIGRWLRSEKVPIDAEVVANLARRLDRNPLEAFVAAGFITEQEASTALDRASLDVLDVVRREAGGKKAAEEAVARLREQVSMRRARGEHLDRDQVVELLDEAVENAWRKYDPDGIVAPGDPWGVITEADAEELPVREPTRKQRPARQD